jgi:hypothetical protein
MAKAPNKTAAFVLTDAHRNLLKDIDTATKAGNVRFVSSAEGAELAKNGFISVDVKNLDANGNAAAVLTEAGTKELPTVSDTTSAPAEGTTPAVTFKIANVAPPPIARNGGSSNAGRNAKFPLGDLQVGQAIFIPATKDDKGAYPEPKKLSKTYGSMVSSFNKNNPVRYVTSRGLADGKIAGFGDEFAGIPGTGIYREDVSKRPVRAPRKAKTADAGTAPAATETPAA